MPAFIHYLTHRELSTDRASRMWFSPKSIQTDALEKVREYSHTPLYHDLIAGLEDYFSSNNGISVLNATSKDLLDNPPILSKKPEYNSKYLGKVLKEELQLTQNEGTYYSELYGTKKAGRYYIIHRELIFPNEEKNITEEDNLPF
jgi:hypothetical protein